MRRVRWNWLVWAGVVLLGFIGGRFLAPSAPKAPRTSPGLSLHVRSMHDRSNPLYTVAAEYPAFDALPDLSQSIASYVDSAITRFTTSSAANWEARQSTRPPGTSPEAPNHPFTFQAAWEPAQINDRYVSVIVRLDWFNGGAHGDQELKTFNYDLAAHRPLALADLFPGNADYLQTVAGYARSSLRSSLAAASDGHAPADMLDAGTQPVEKNFANFTFTDQVITLYFQKYQVAPGVFGPQSVVLSRAR